ncbi:MAG TPA: hypothetical protein VGL69_12795 [Solirubrobacteraceae bacterium]|jgi:hypothetical protein
MDGNDPAHSTPEELSEREREQEKLSREAASGAETEEEARVNLRRADKARYLREKLDQQTRADEELDR